LEVHVEKLSLFGESVACFFQTYTALSWGDIFTMEQRNLRSRKGTYSVLSRKPF